MYAAQALLLLPSSVSAASIRSRKCCVGVLAAEYTSLSTTYRRCPERHAAYSEYIASKPTLFSYTLTVSNS
ncbi:hypothetical protein V8C42DRAFT_328326 [Trichoderma barbatum]